MQKTVSDSGGTREPTASLHGSEAILAKAEEILGDRIRKALEDHEHSQVGSSKTKEALLKVIQAALFESGLLERTVGRAVDQKLKSVGDAKGGAPTGGAGREEVIAAIKDYLSQNFAELCGREIHTVIQKDVQAILGGEQFKEILEEKFRAISIYLKTDVIPKAVAQQLKQATK